MFFIILKACAQAIDSEIKRLPIQSGRKLTDYQLALHQAKDIIIKLMRFN